MTPEKWALLTKLCNEALSYHGVDRHSFLELQCKGDADLRKEVESLIASYESDPDFLESSITDSNPQTESDRVIGQYQLIRLLGRGGMGDVFLALQKNTRQHVALKLIRPSFNRANLLKRFELEQQILADLDHPNISRLMDLGETEDQLPYLVMEYVEGRPITDYCTDNKLSIEERLGLFKQVSSAIQYAHQNLVVHRDIKPSNLLVDANGTVKLLDFGIAKMLQVADKPVSVFETQTGVHLMTPAYASPEQVQGVSITTSSDVYSLGILLYELLTGTRPFDLQEKNRSEIFKIISEQQPTKPSTAIGARGDITLPGESSIPKLRKLLSGELDNIVLKALRKEPSRRYASAAEMSADIDRYLNGMPVLAQPDSFQYRTSKFVARHKLAVAMASVLVLTLIGFSGLTAWQSKVVAEERDRAQDEANKSAQVSEFLQSLFKSADPVETPRDTLRVRDFLEEGTERIENELEGQPELQIAMLNTIGSAYLNLGRLDKSETLFYKSYQLSKEFLDQTSPAYKESLENLISAYRLMSKEEEEIELLYELIEIDRNDLGETHGKVIANLFNLSSNYHFQRKKVQADSLQEIAHRLLSQSDPEDEPGLALALRSAGKMQWGNRQYIEAHETFKRTAAMEKRLYGERNPELSYTLSHMAQNLVDMGDFVGAEKTVKENIELQEYYFPEGHRDLGTSYMQLSEIYLFDESRLADAEMFARKGIEMYEKVLDGGESYMIGFGQNTLGRVLQKQKRYKEAEVEYRNSIHYYESLFGSSFPTTIERRQDLAMLLVETGEFDEAESILKPDYEYLLRKRGPIDNYTEPVRRRLEILYNQWGKPELAARYPKPKNASDEEGGH